MKAALKEFEKETGFVTEPEDFKFLLNDFNYNCDVYTLKVHLNTELDLIESNKNEKYEKFFFRAYKRMAKKDHTIPIHTICIELIFYRIKLKSEILKRKATKQSQSKKIL